MSVSPYGFSRIASHSPLARLRLGPTRHVLYPPLKGEGRTAEGSPGWGGGGAPRYSRPDLRHGRHPHPARWRGPTSPLQGEVIRDAHPYANKASPRQRRRVASGPSRNGAASCAGGVILTAEAVSRDMR